MKVKDIISLVKAGYTPAEIGSLGEDQEAVLEFVSGGVSKDDIPTLLEISRTVSDDKPDPGAEETPPDPEEDYKGKYEALMQKLQKESLNKDQSGNQKSSDELLADIVKDFM